MFTIGAHHDHGTPISVEVRGHEFATKAEAEAVAALFPKYLLARAESLNYYPTKTEPAKVTWHVNLRVTLLPSKGNAVNETGIKRYRAFRRVCTTHNLPVEFLPVADPAYRYTEDQLHALIGGL